MIWNNNREEDSSIIKTYQTSAKSTRIGQTLEYINSLITYYFNTNNLKFVRIFSASNHGLVISHRDYLDLEASFYLFYIPPLQINLSCFNSEEEYVYQMQLGEVWYIDANRVHSTAYFFKQKHSFVKTFLNFSNIIYKKNFYDMVAILVKVQFKKTVHSALIFYWLNFHVIKVRWFNLAYTRLFNFMHN